MSFQTKLDLSQQSRIPTGQTADWQGSVNIGETLRIGGFEIDPRSPFLGSTLLFDGFTQSYKSGKVIGNTGIATGYDGDNLIISFTGSSTTVGPRLQSINNLTTDGIMVNYGTDVTTVSLSGSSDFSLYNPSGILGSSIELSLSNTGVSGGTYGSSTIIPRIQVDNKGRIIGVTGTTVNIVSALSGLTDVYMFQPIPNNSILMYDNNVDLWFNGSVAQSLGYTPVTEGRTLTINGESYDLTADRSWTVDALPSQSGNTGYFLTTNGSVASWSPVNLSGYIPLTGTSVSGKIAGDLVTSDSTTIKFGRDQVATGSDQGSWFEVRHGGGSGSIGMYSKGSSLGFTAGISFDYTGINTINSYSTTITASEQVKIFSNNQNLWLSATNNDILMFAKNLKLPSRPTVDRGTSDAYIAYNSQTAQFEGQRAGSWKNFLMEGDLVAYSGTTNRITVSAGVIDISSAYTGQTSITSVGTLTSGALGSGFTAIADAEIASASTWNAKLGTGGGTLTGALNYAPSVTLPSSATVDLGAINSNNIIITGTTAISSFGTCAEGIIRNVRFTGVLGLTAVSNMPNGFTFTVNGDEGIFRSLGAGAWTCVSYKAITSISNSNIPYFDIITQRFVNSYFTQTSSSGVIMNNTNNQNARLIGQGIGVNKWSIQQNNAGTYTLVSGSGGVVVCADFENVSLGYVWVKNGENQYTNTLHAFYTNAGSKYAEISSSGLALGSATINALTQLDLQSTTKGLGLNLVAGDLGTTRNGLMWYDTIANQFKGVQNGGIVNLLSGSGLTNNYLTYWDGSKLINSPISRTSTGVVTLDNEPSVNTPGIRFKNSGGTTITSQFYVQTVNDWAVVAGGQIAFITSGNSSIQARNDGYNRYESGYHEFLTSGTRHARLDSSGLALGSATINSSTQLDLQSTTKGLGLPLVGFGVLPTASSRIGNVLTSSTGTTSGSTFISNGVNWTKVYTTLTGSTGNVGTATLVGGAATVNTTKVTANSIIQLTVQGGTLTNVGFQYISARVNGTSFTITSSNTSDTCDVGWMIIEP